jgi:hypothetical protein
MKLPLVLLASVLLLSSCDGGLIPRGKMTRIVSEIYLSDKYMSSNMELSEGADSLLIYEPILNKYGYDTEDYLRTISYYVERPSKLRTIYTDAQNLLQKELDRVNKRLSDVRRVDSLRIVISTQLIDLKPDEERDAGVRSLRWILFPEMDEAWERAAPDTSAVRYDSPVSFHWWKENIRLKTKPFFLYENDRRKIPVDLKLESAPERVRKAG